MNKQKGVFEGNEAHSNGDEGFLVEGTLPGLDLTGCIASGNGGAGFRVEAGTSGAVFKDCVASGNGSSGYYVEGKATFENSHALNNAGPGFTVVQPPTSFLASIGLPSDTPIQDLIALLSALQEAAPGDRARIERTVSDSRFGSWLSTLADGSTVMTAIAGWCRDGYLGTALEALKKFAA